MIRLLGPGRLYVLPSGSEVLGVDGETLFTSNGDGVDALEPMCEVLELRIGGPSPLSPSP